MLNRLRAFMAGRYGLDQLSLTIIIFAIIINFAARFVLYWPLVILSLILYALAVYRMFSRNFTARRSENVHFMHVWNKIRSFFLNIRTRIRDSKTHRFFKCPSCKNTLRVPKNRGRLVITCPKCGERFEKKT